LSLLARSAFKLQAIFFLAFLEHVFLSFDKAKVAWEVSVAACAVDIPDKYFFLSCI
jgi:hypothetical protein